MPAMLGVLAGSLAGGRRLPGAGTQALRFLFAAAVGVLAAEMLYSSIAGGTR